MGIKAEDIKALSNKYISSSGVAFRLVEMPFGYVGLLWGISKSRLIGAHLQIDITRTCGIADEKRRSEITALFNRFIRFYKAHWVEVAE